MSPTIHGGDASSEPFSILFVEDDVSIARLVSSLLLDQGYRVEVAGTLADARHLLADEPFDLILLDRMLPDGDGLDLVRELKSDTSALSRYILVLSSVDSREAKVEGFDNGADDYVTKPFAHEELFARVRSGLRIVELQKALIAGNRRLERISTTDAITGVRNRRWFDEELERSFAHATRYDRPLSLAILDIDYFKTVNDTYGHLTGDSALREVSDRISRTLRKSDSIARVGGEEFALLLPETSLFEGLQFGEKIRSVVNEGPFAIDGESIAVTISVGIASIPHSRLTRATQLMMYADKALYRAKNRGRDRVELERRTEPWRPTTSAPIERRRRSSNAAPQQLAQ